MRGAQQACGARSRRAGSAAGAQAARRAGAGRHGAGRALPRRAGNGRALGAGAHGRRAAVGAGAQGARQQVWQGRAGRWAGGSRGGMGARGVRPGRWAGGQCAPGCAQLGQVGVLCTLTQFLARFDSVLFLSH